MAGIILNGSVIKGLMLNGSSVSAMLNGVKVFPAEEPGPTPVPLPANTIRVRTSDGNPPNKGSASYETATLVEGTTDVYDVYKSGTSFKNLLYNSSNVIEVLGGNTTGITDMSYMFYYIEMLKTVAVFDTSTVSNMDRMFYACTDLKAVPLLNTSLASNTYRMFYGCRSVETGALALYQQMSAHPPFTHGQTFRNCGSSTTTGSAELEQIPSDWK